MSTHYQNTAFEHRFRILAATIMLAVLLVVPKHSANAAVLIESGGELVGASGIVVNGAVYDAMFIDGTCDARVRRLLRQREFYVPANGTL